MEQIKTLFDVIRSKFSTSAVKDSVASKPISAGDRHVVVLSEIAVSFGAGGGTGETSGGEKTSQAPAKGTGGGAGGAAKASPVAILVIENGVVRVEPLA